MGIRKQQRRMNSKGETLVETLVALLVAALVISLLVSMITVSARLLRNSEKDLTAYYAAETEMASADSGSLLKSDKIRLVDELGNTLTIAGEGDVDVSFYANGDAGNTPVISYKKG